MLVLPPYPAGHAPKSTVKAAERELESLRRALSERNTIYCNVGEYVQILDEMLKHLPLLHGPEGLIVWLAEVQHFTRLMRCRTLDGSTIERDHIEMYVAYWRQRRGGALCMARPEAQIVLLTLRDFVQTYNATFTMARDRDARDVRDVRESERNVRHCSKLPSSV